MAFFPTSGSNSAAVIGNPMSRSIKKPPRRQSHDRKLLAHLFSAILLSVFGIIGYYQYFAANNHDAAAVVGEDEESRQKYLNRRAGLARKRWEEQGLPSQQQHSKRQSLSNGGSPKHRLRTASIDTVIRYLTELAELPPSKLWDVLGMDDDDNDKNGQYGIDPFSLRDLENGKCPRTTSTSKKGGEEIVEWLPPRPYNSASIAEQYRNNMKSSSKKYEGRGKTPKQPPMGRYDAKNEVLLWYEHMSKAGGTTFCGLANSNMMPWQVPNYHCMPRKGKLKDGRVGSWPNDELVSYLTENGHAIVSNEWNAFSLEKLKLSKRRLDGTAPNRGDSSDAGPRLLFLTTLRDTPDRLLSAYTFFELTTKGRDDGPTFDQWIERILARALNENTRRFFRSNIARMNHVVWRFSGGALPLRLPHDTPTEDEWKPPFKTAIQALSQHDLILPMDVMTKKEGKTALSRLLGWEKFDTKGRALKGDKEGGHVVTTGGVKNSNAREYFRKEEYRALWENNWLDNILCLWCRAVFLARLHCDDIIVEL